MEGDNANWHTVFTRHVDIPDSATSLSEAFRSELEAELAEYAGGSVHLYEGSYQHKAGATHLLARFGSTKHLVVVGAEDPPFDVEVTLDHPAGSIHVCPCSRANAEMLRTTFPWTNPVPLGTESAIGCGDRLGLATPGHIRACRATELRPVLAQQSIREMERTGRTPQEVLDDASWAVFQAGYQDGFGADADHLKTTDDIDRCVAAGYTMYTIDPSDSVDTEADDLDREALDDRFAALPWDALGTTPDACLDRYAADPIEVGADDPLRIDFEKEALKRAAVKYGAALAHTKNLADHLARRYRSERPEETYDLEMSVDETAHPTRPREHLFVAAELQRLGVEVMSLAPRFVGDFQKGIDFIGDLDEFEGAFEKHAHIASALGDYKLSIHSGSDKFSIYPIMGRHAGNRIHLKTAGTSYLEALRIVARHAPGLFREIVDFAFDRFQKDRKTYHVTTDLDVIPAADDVPDSELESTYLDEDNGRQLLHITYGSVLSATEDGRSRFKDRFLSVLHENEEEHYETLKAHFLDHIDGVWGS